MKNINFIYILAFATVTFLGCSEESTPPEDDCVADPTYNPIINPAAFVAGVDNPLWPLVPETKYVFQGVGGETIEVTVTDSTKEILGVTTIEVHDVVTVNGELKEDTYDWYARDTTGNVWYFGEDTKEYENGVVVSTAGTWEAGVDGAKPGIVMHATQPPVGEDYRQEYYVCEAEDMAEVVSLSESVVVQYGSFNNCLKTREFTPLDTAVNEYKYYAPGIGLILEVDVATGDRTELVQITP